VPCLEDVSYSVKIMNEWEAYDRDYSCRFDYGFSVRYATPHSRREDNTNSSPGGFNIMRYGAGPQGPLRTLGQYMLGSGATFGYILPYSQPPWSH
jgi:hypothetical protein